MDPSFTATQAPSEASVPYGHTCAPCAKAKQKCISRGEKCVRCHRRGLECRPSATRVRKRGARTASVLQSSQIENKLDDLMSLLRAHNAIPQATPDHHVAPTEPGTGAATSTLGNNTPTTSQRSSAPPSAAHLFSGEGSAAHHDASQSIPCGSSPPSNDDELCQSHADELLDTFRTHYLRHFPFTYLAPEVSAQNLQLHRPFLWMNIQAICTRSSSQREILGQQVREYFARKFIIDLEKDIDILQGILTYLGWSLYHFSGKPFLRRFASAANALVAEMRLHETLESARAVHHINSQPHSNDSSTSSTVDRTNEERRAILATFIISSMSLAEQPEYYGDEMLVAVAQIRQFVEEVAECTACSLDYS
ncbi:uncharacterized protein PG998_003940 [Apiospora kogelbergensis]|uniref:uncharacterized protein n=1 Tax=Apiospora kogelbergensis TaxID=1337665 RepID=UPI00312F0EFA